MRENNSLGKSDASISIYQILELLKRHKSFIFYLGLTTFLLGLVYVLIFFKPTYTATVFINPSYINEKALYSKEYIVKYFALPNSYSEVFYDKCEGSLSFELKQHKYPESLIIFNYEDQDKTLTKLCSEIISSDLINYLNRLPGLEKGRIVEIISIKKKELAFLSNSLKDDPAKIDHMNPFDANKFLGNLYDDTLSKKYTRFYILELEIFELNNSILPPKFLEAKLVSPINVIQKSVGHGSLKVGLIMLAVWLFITTSILFFLEFFPKLQRKK